VSLHDDVTPEPARCDCKKVLCGICHPTPPKPWVLTDDDRRFLRVNKIDPEE
jgi:hypothetical protein